MKGETNNIRMHVYLKEFNSETQITNFGARIDFPKGVPVSSEIFRAGCHLSLHVLLS